MNLSNMALRMRENKIYSLINSERNSKIHSLREGICGHADNAVSLSHLKVLESIKVISKQFMPHVLLEVVSANVQHA